MNDQILWLKRRLYTREIKGTMDLSVSKETESTDPCKYRTIDDYVHEVIEKFILNFTKKWDYLYYSDDYMELDDFIYGIISNNYTDNIMNKYNDRSC